MPCGPWLPGSPSPYATPPPPGLGSPCWKPPSSTGPAPGAMAPTPTPPTRPAACTCRSTKPTTGSAGSPDGVLSGGFGGQCRLQAQPRLSHADQALAITPPPADPSAHACLAPKLVTRAGQGAVSALGPPAAQLLARLGSCSGLRALGQTHSAPIDGIPEFAGRSGSSARRW